MDLVPELRCVAWGHGERIIRKGEDREGAVKFVPPRSLSACAVINQSRRDGGLCRKRDSRHCLLSNTLFNIWP